MTPPLEQLARDAADGDREALDALVKAVQDDVYGLALRMLGVPPDAQDATQEILVKVITHVGSYRGESAFRTWVWKIATRHILKMRRGRYESTVDFASIEALLDQGTGLPASTTDDAEVQRLADEVRLGCTQAMLVALDRDHRIVYVLGDVLGFSSDEASHVLDLDAATFRKRLQRARMRLGAFMRRKCGLVDPVAACRCVRQIPVLEGRGLLDPKRLTYSEHPVRSGSGATIALAWSELTELDTLTRTMRDVPSYGAPTAILAALRQLLESKRLRVLQ